LRDSKQTGLDLGVADRQRALHARENAVRERERERESESERASERESKREKRERTRERERERENKREREQESVRERPEIVSDRVSASVCWRWRGEGGGTSNDCLEHLLEILRADFQSARQHNGHFDMHACSSHTHAHVVHRVYIVIL
jgi:hypothetical protein